ncbi:hypothetical protein BU16DRAFT_472014 [Lophium mytilinum]|uniref:Actin-like ATPase domain-containing protein n=1 Tax=Lophium mytilinum TaxID=390894 RepID=A0A6A6QBJ1_9PEZI|nr:hypothetical protein BU16DRAFT_472014 [Lophium mytilinum]
MEETRPDLIIAIDFGMTCTGVAYANPSIGADTIRWIQRWPGRMQANENKVPTILVYPNDQPNPSSWGFLSETMTEVTAVDKEFREWFKTFLDEGRLSQAQRDAKDPADVPKSIEEVEKLFCDYFKFLYQHIRSKLQNEIAARWEDARIDFIFSVPTTWAPNPTVERFRKIIERAGFGQYPSHIASIGLTEAEAAAVHMSRESPAIFLERDILVVCDVGGGTTDLSALRVTDTGSGSLSLEQLDVVFGANLGSAQIDRGFENAALQRLEFANRSLPMGIEVEDAAWEMMKSKEYQNAKCDYGAEDDTPMFSVAVPKLSRTYTNESAGIINGELRFQRDDLKILFDAQQIDRLFGLIDKQLTRINQKFPQEQVAHLVLSGGLGNSAYLQQRLRERYAFGRAPFPNALRLQVGVAPDPQLVVCKGIVADRIQKMKSGKSVLGWRCCRSSYGTICKVLYNPQNPMHHNKATERDPMDGQLYIANVIDWFIKQGDPVSIDYPIVRSFRQKVTPGNPKRVFPTAVIESHLDKTLLPFSDFSTVELAKFKLKNRHFWNRGQKYHRVDYVVKVVLGPADIRFELCKPLI